MFTGTNIFKGARESFHEKEQVALKGMGIVPGFGNRKNECLHGESVASVDE